MKTVYEIVQIKQVVQESQLACDVIKTPQDAAEIAYSYIGEDDREVVLVLCLNTKNRVIAVHRAHIGSLNSSLVSPREVYKSAILNNASSIIMAHQHPSGDSNESKEDVKVAKRLHEAGKILNIALLDALVIGEYTNNTLEFVSLKDKDYLI